MISATRIRNFCIIAHIDHGKSTLADRLLEVTGTVVGGEMRDQLLDDMDLERERGITIKSHAVQMNFNYRGDSYKLNLIDTPGHVDFSYEVSRSVAACEGALLLVDATQGVQAQTLANLELAREQGLVIIPVLNKVDMDGAQLEEVGEEVTELLGCGNEDIILASGKEGIGVEDILEAIVKRIPAPQGSEEELLQAMVFDATYDPYRGVKVFVRLFNGALRVGDKVCFLQTNREYQVEEVGCLTRPPSTHEVLYAGDVGYFIAHIKRSKEVAIGDTVTHVVGRAVAVKGFEEVKPMVFASVYPISNEEYEALKRAIERLQLNDAALVAQPESSVALGFGFRCGFLGMLHMEIVKERLEREAGLSVIMTMPSVALRVRDKKGVEHVVRTPSELPPAGDVERIEEPIVRVKILTKSLFVGKVMELCMGKRASFENQVYLSRDRVELVFVMPLGEIVFGFFDRLKSISQGYASLEYRQAGYAKADLVKVDILIHGKVVDALSVIVHRDKAYRVGKEVCDEAKEIIPRHQFEVPIQASLGGKVIARTTVKAFRKNVIEGLYGGDVSRKKKQLQAQKRGKKRMKQIGKVNLPSDVFMKLLRVR